MTTYPQLPQAYSTIGPVHHALATPIRLLSAVGIGPFGGENNISAVIEAVLAMKRNEPVGFDLSKTDQFFTGALTKGEIPDEMIEYRELNHEVQEEVIARYGGKKLGVIWLGAGVFTLRHPLLAYNPATTWHIWTDASPKIVADSRSEFERMRQRGESSGLSYDLTLPQDVDKINEWIEFVIPNAEHIILFGYGVTYALTIEENYRWLSQIKRPAGVDFSFVFNSPGSTIPTLPGVMAAFHNQEMVYYEDEHIAALFEAALPGSEIVWKKGREQTRNKMWGTWLVHLPAS